MQKNPILAFVGASGVGKSSLMIELMKLKPDRFFPVRSLATRPKRGPEDDIFYKFMSAEKIKEMKANGELLQYLEYNGNLYGTAFADVNWALDNGLGVQAYVQSAIFDLQKAGYKVVPIKIVADREVFRSEERLQIDKEREKIDLPYELIVENSFEPGGFKKAVNQLLEFADRFN